MLLKKFIVMAVEYVPKLDQCANGAETAASVC